MVRHATGMILVICILLSLLCGCASVNTPDETQPETSVATESPSEASTEAPTEAPTEPETEPTTQPPTEPPADISLSRKTLILTQKGQTKEIYCGEVPLEELSWFSEDESIAIFSQGTVIAINEGSTRVYAQYMDQTVSCDVFCVVDPEAHLPGLPDSLIHAPRLGAPVVDMEDTSFFDDAAFIGDSVSYVLQQWHNQNGAFGDAVFLVRSSMGLQNMLDGRMKLFFRGREYSPDEALAVAGVSKVFIMFGFNDLGLYGIEGTIDRWEQFTDRILQNCPEIQIYIQSCTPIHHAGEYPGYDNELFDAYNVALEAFCREKGYHFVNIAPYFKDFTNSMPTAYSSDCFVHMTYEGTAVWERVLKAYAAEQIKGETQ